MLHPLVVQLGRGAMLAGGELMSAGRLLVLAARGMDGVGHADLQAGPLAMARLFEGAHTPGPRGAPSTHEAQRARLYCRLPVIAHLACARSRAGRGSRR